MSYCQDSKLFQDGVVTDKAGNAVFCFIYVYDKRNNLKSIIFREFMWTENGYRTLNKIAKLRVQEGNQLKVFGHNRLSPDFIKYITKI